MKTEGDRQQEEECSPSCCPLYHEAVELIGRRWTGAIVEVLMQGGPLRFGEIGAAVPELSDRLLSERMKELEARGVVMRIVSEDVPNRTRYDLTPMGRSLEPAVSEIKAWAREWLKVVAATETGAAPAAPRPSA
jgi:DNA-binding HxlR family transcriptional regulator